MHGLCLLPYEQLSQGLEPPHVLKRMWRCSLDYTNLYYRALLKAWEDNKKSKKTSDSRNVMAPFKFQCSLSIIEAQFCWSNLFYFALCGRRNYCQHYVKGLWPFQRTNSERMPPKRQLLLKCCKTTPNHMCIEQVPAGKIDCAFETFPLPVQ